MIGDHKASLMATAVALLRLVERRTNMILSFIFRTG